MLIGIPMRSPDLRPDQSALLTIALVLAGRAAIVPSSARRTLFIGALALGPLLAVVPLFYPAGGVIAGIPHRRPVRVTLCGFALATLAVALVTSQVICKLRRSVRHAIWCAAAAPCQRAARSGCSGRSPRLSRKPTAKA